MKEMLMSAKNKLMDNSGLEGIEYTVVLVVVLGVIVTAIVLFAGNAQAVHPGGGRAEGGHAHGHGQFHIVGHCMDIL